MSAQELPLTLEQLLRGLLQGMRDPRVGAAVARDFFPELSNHVRERFFAVFEAQLGDDAADFEGFPAEATNDVDAALAHLSTRATPFLKHGGAAVAELASAWVQAQRTAIVERLKATGELATPDRGAILARAAALLDQAEVARRTLEALPKDADRDTMAETMAPAIDTFEEARGILTDLELDLALLAPAPERAIDVEGLLLRSWQSEADLHVAAAERVGPTLNPGAIGSFEQSEFLLDAIVAVQEALQVRFDPATALRLAALRHAKGDVGEARALCENVLSAEELEDALRADAEALLACISQSSPLGKDSRCFVATAAMGSADAFEVMALRRFRDRVLSCNRPGRVLIAAYYRASPPLARLIARHDILRSLIRRLMVQPLARLVARSEVQS